MILSWKRKRSTQKRTASSTHFPAYICAQDTYSSLEQVLPHRPLCQIVVHRSRSHSFKLLNSLIVLFQLSGNMSNLDQASVSLTFDFVVLDMMYDFYTQLLVLFTLRVWIFSPIPVSSLLIGHKCLGQVFECQFVYFSNGLLLIGGLLEPPSFSEDGNGLLNRKYTFYDMKRDRWTLGGLRMVKKSLAGCPLIRWQGRLFCRQTLPSGFPFFNDFDAFRYALAASSFSLILMRTSACLRKASDASLSMTSSSWVSKFM